MAELALSTTGYEELDEYLGRKTRRPLGRKTYVRRCSDAIRVRLHDTDILTYFPDGWIQLFSGGWQTVTTRDRWNTLLPNYWRVSTTKGVAYLFDVSDGWEDAKQYGFEDGMMLNPETREVRGSCDVKEKAKLRKQVAGYAKDFIDGVIDGSVPKPGGGDCWFCLALVKGSPLAGKMMVGTLTTDGKMDVKVGVRPDHLISHMSKDERYYVPSLLHAALKEMGASPSMFWWVGHYWYPEQRNSDQPVFDERKCVEKALRKYVNRSLGLAP
jgi:hypothetical protein